MAFRNGQYEGHGYDLWMTPPEIFNQLDEMFPGWNFSHDLDTPGIYGYFDPCPPDWDGKTGGLEIDWPMSVPVFVNPPYSKMKEWAAKCREQAERALGHAWPRLAWSVDGVRLHLYVFVYVGSCYSETERGR